MKNSFNIKGYPTFILADKEGETYYRWWGYSKEALFKELDAGFADLTTIAEKEQRFVSNPDAATAKALASYSQTQNEIKKAVEYYSLAADLDAENDYLSDLFYLHVSGYYRNIFTLEELTEMADKSLKSALADDHFKISVYAQMSSHIKDDPENKKLLAYLTEGNELLAKNKSDEAGRAEKTIALNYALFIEKDIPKAIVMKKNTLKAGWENNANALNGFSWWCFEHKINLKEAEELGRRAVKLAPAGREKAMILDTVAEIVNLQGNPAEAVVLMEAAVKEDPATEQWQKQLERFKKEVNKT